MNTTYFTSELQKKINALTDTEMENLLLGLEKTRSWIAVLKYLQGRQIFAQNGLQTMDPVKDLVVLCRTQGTLMGLSDLVNAVIILKDKETAANNVTDIDSMGQNS